MNLSMLSPSLLTAGFVSDAVPLSIMLPRSRHEQPFLIVRRDAVPVAVFLGEVHRFRSMECPGNSSWAGAIVGGVAVEVDWTSIFDADTESAAGAVVRTGAGLFIGAIPDVRYTHGLAMLTVADGMPPCRDRMAVGFRRWTVTLRTGLDRRELLSVEVE